MKIYRLIKNNNTIYVGATTKKYLCHRVGHHKYLGKNFDSYELIEETDDPSREAYWIDYYDTYNNGLNTSDNGIGGQSNINKKRKVRVYNDVYDNTFDSFTEAANELSLNCSSMSKVARGVEKTHKGYKISYIDQ